MKLIIKIKQYMLGQPMVNQQFKDEEEDES